MKKLRTFLSACALLGTAPVVLVGCNNNNGGETQVFSFTLSLQNNANRRIVLGETDKIVINAVNAPADATYTFRSNTPSVLKVDEHGNLTTVTARDEAVTITVTETTTGEIATIKVTVYDITEKANGGFNYSSSANQDDIQRRTEILGKLEKYAYDKHLTGITLFENGGKVKYSKRTVIPAKNYITGYGFGILSEGILKGTLSGDTDGAYKDFYHSAQTNNTNDMNAWNASGSQIGDLAAYISSSYWSTRMDESRTGYEWFPQLAADTYKNAAGQEVPNERPVAVKESGDTSVLSRKWKIYVKTDANLFAKTGKHLYLHSKKAGYENVPVTLADYEFAYRMILTGSSNMSRGTEMAGDKTYGIKGAQTYYDRTKTSNDTQAKTIWDQMKAAGELGIKTGTDNGGDYVELEIINDIDSFTAMYTLSSSLVSPMNEAFIKSLGDGSIADGLDKYGKQGNTPGVDKLAENVMGCGAYRLDVWESDTNGNIVFKRNDDWFEYNPDKRYIIPGIRIKTYNGATQDQLWTYFEQGELDSCSIPTKAIKTAKNDEIGTIYETEGDSTFKLNINSCTQERWNELFGPNGTIKKNAGTDADWQGDMDSCVKPWMSNDNFLKGLYWSIDRKNFAESKGMKPSINYFSNAYLSDPEHGISYNSTEAHKNAIKDYDDYVAVYDDNNNPVLDDEGKQVYQSKYGFDKEKARNYFKSAIKELKAEGKVTGNLANPTVIQIHIRWMYVTDETDYGVDIANYIESAFNGDDNKGIEGVRLEVKQKGVTNWEDVYTKFLQIGKFDLAFGAISGNTYNPLNFLEVLKSDNSSTFTLNWGPDTSKIDELDPIKYDGKLWSFDSLWECADHGGIVKDGEITKVCESYHIVSEYNDLMNGGTVDIQLKFIQTAGVQIRIKKIVCYVIEADNSQNEMQYVDNGDGTFTITVSKEFGEHINQQLMDYNNKYLNPGDQGYKTSGLFTRNNYGLLYTFDVYYELQITGFNASENVITIVKQASDEK